MKVLHLFDHSVPYFSGYTFRSGYILSNQRKLGFEPVVLTSLKHQKQDELVETIDGQKFYRTAPFENPVCQAAARFPVVRESMQMHRLYHRILDVHRTEGFDLIHAHSPALNGYPAVRAGRLLKRPVVYEIRAFWEDAGMDLGTYKGEQTLKYKAVRRFETRLCHQADAVTTICDGLKKDLWARNVDPKKIFVIPNGVEAERFVPLPRNQELMRKLELEPGKVIGFIGSFYDYEGLDLLLETFSRALKQRGDLKLLLVGGGYQGQDESLKALSARLGLNGRCIFTGRVPHADVNDYYSVIDLFVYPRRSKRVTELVTPLKPLEAMAMEKIVLGSSVGGIAELIQDGSNGYLFEPDNPDAAASVLLEVLNDPDKLEHTGARARKFIEAERNWTKIIKRYIKVYAHAQARFGKRK